MLSFRIQEIDKNTMRKKVLNHERNAYSDEIYQMKKKRKKN